MSTQNKLAMLQNSMTKTSVPSLLPVRQKTTSEPETENEKQIAAIDSQIATIESAARAVSSRTDLTDYEKRLAIANLGSDRNDLVQQKIAIDPNIGARLASAAGNIVATSAGGMTAAAEVAKDVLSGNGASTGYDPDSKSAQYFDYANKAKETALSGTTGATRWLGEVALGVGQSLSTLPLAVISPALPAVAMGLTAAGSKAAEVKQQGGTSTEALFRGLGSGVIEGVTERFPIRNFFDAIKFGGKSAVKSVLKQAGIEASEEGLSYTLNYLADKFAKDPNATFSIKELANVVGMGAASGGIMGTFGVAGGKMNDSYVPTPEAKAQATPNNELPDIFAETTSKDQNIADDQIKVADDIVEPVAEKTVTEEVETIKADPAVNTIPTREAELEPIPTAERQTGKVNPDDSVGAAPLGFTGDTERGYSKNLGSDKARHDDIQHEYQVNPQMYFRLANKDTLAKATAIMDTGLESAKSELEKALGAAQSGMKLAPEMVPLSKMVADKLAAEGRMDEAERILSSVAVELTQAGQLGQAAIILRDSSPTAKIQTLEKAIEKINTEGKARYKDKWKDLALTDAEKAEAANIKPGDEEAFTALYEKVAKRLGSEIPSTMWEKLSEVRRVFMLLNPKTQLRNFFGNAPLMAVRKTAEKLSGAAQDFAVKKGWLDEEDQTRTRKVSEGSRELAKQLFEQQKESLSGAAEKWDVNGMIQQYRKYFGDSGAGKAADAVREFTYKMLEKGDIPFLKSAFVDSAAQYIEAHGIKSLADMTQEGIDFATQQAMEATFRDFSVVASTLNKLKKQGVGGAALDILFPFTTTPINVAKRTAEYSPAGLLSVFSKNKDVAQKIDALAKGLTGSGVVLLGALLAKYGLATAGADENKDKAALDKATGTSPYSIAGRVSYEWAQPVGTQLAMGAAAWDAAKNGDGNAWWEALKAGGDTVLDMTIFSNLKDLFSGYGSPTETIIDTLTSGVASQMTPSLLGAAARIIDPTVRTSSYNEGAFENVKTSALAKIPGASKTLPALINVKGEETKRVEDPFLRALQEGFNPANVNTGERNAVDNEIYRLYDATGEFSVFPKKVGNSIEYDNTTITLNAKDKMQYQQTIGQTYYSMVAEMMDSPTYKNATSEEQVEYLKKAEEYATQAAKKGVIGVAFEPEKFYENAQKAEKELGISEAEFLLLYEKYGGTALNGDGVRDAYASGLDIEDYLDYHAGKKGYDADGNKSYTIGETNAAIKGSGLSSEDQVLLWLIENPEWGDDADKYGVEASLFVDFKVATMGIKADRDKNGKAISGSAKEKTLKAINGLNASKREKDKLYLAAGYAESGLNSVPWR